MPEFSRKDLNSRKLELEYLNMNLTFGYLNCGSLLLSDCLDDWIAKRSPCLCLNFVRTVNWFSIPAKIDWIGWISYFHFEFWSMTWTVIPANFVWFMIVDLNRYFRANVWILIDDLIQYSREIVDLNRYSMQLFDFWSMNWFNNPAKLLTSIVIPERSFEFWSMTWAVLPRNCWLEPLFPCKRLNFDRWFDSIFPRNCWLESLFLSDRLNFDRWHELFFREIVDLNRYFRANVWILIDDLIQYSREIVDLNRYSMQLFDFWSMNWFNIPAKLLTWISIIVQLFVANILNCELFVTVLLYFSFIFSL